MFVLACVHMKHVHLYACVCVCVTYRCTYVNGYRVVHTCVHGVCGIPHTDSAALSSFRSRIYVAINSVPDIPQRWSYCMLQSNKNSHTLK